MDDWEEAFWLTKFHLKKSISTILVLLIVTLIALIIMIGINEFIIINPSGDFIGINNSGFLLFIFIFPNLIATSARTVEVGRHQATPYVIALNQFAIKKSIIVKHRLLSKLIITFSLQAFLLISLYLFTGPLREAVPLGTYLVFALIWLCLSISVGSIFIFFEIGHRLRELFLIIGGFFIIMLVIYFIEVAPSMTVSWNLQFPPRKNEPILSMDWEDTKGIVNWTLLFARQQPLLSSGISILFAIIGWNYWTKRTLKKMNKIDYF